MKLDSSKPADHIININTSLLKDILHYVRKSEEIMDEEYGVGYDWKKLEEMGDMPEVYYKLKSILHTR